MIEGKAIGTDRPAVQGYRLEGPEEKATDIRIQQTSQEQWQVRGEWLRPGSCPPLHADLSRQKS